MAFEEIKLGWGDEIFTCPENKVWSMIRHLEKSGVDIMAVAGGHGVVSKCDALSVSLEFLGMKNPPSSEDIYEALFLGTQTNAPEFMLALQMMVIPPNVKKRALEMSESEAEKNAIDVKKKPKKVAKKKKAS